MRNPYLHRRNGEESFMILTVIRSSLVLCSVFNPEKFIHSYPIHNMRSLTFTDLHTMGFPRYAVTSAVVFSPSNEAIIGAKYMCLLSNKMKLLLLLHMCAIIFMYMRFVTLLIKIAWNYILLRIDVESQFNNAIRRYENPSLPFIKTIFIAVVVM